MGLCSVLTAPIKLELKNRPASALLLHWLEPGCDVDTLPLLSTERRGKGRFTENVATIAPCYNIYEHIPGRLNTLADALSRTHINSHYNALANDLVQSLSLNWVMPSLHPLQLVQHVLSRHCPTEPEGQRAGQTGGCQSPWDEQEQALSNTSIPTVLLSSQVAPSGADPPADMCVYRTPQLPRDGPSISPQSCGPYSSVPAARGRTAHSKPLQSRPRPGGDDEEEGLQESGQAPTVTADDIGRTAGSTCHKRVGLSKGRNINDFLWRLLSRGGSATDHHPIRPATSPHQSGRGDGHPPDSCQRQSREKPPEILPEAQNHHIQSSRPFFFFFFFFSVFIQA